MKTCLKGLGMSPQSSGWHALETAPPSGISVQRPQSKPPELGLSSQPRARGNRAEFSRRKGRGFRRQRRAPAQLGWHRMAAGTQEKSHPRCKERQEAREGTSGKTEQDLPSCEVQGLAHGQRCCSEGGGLAGKSLVSLELECRSPQCRSPQRSFNCREMEPATPIR